MKNYEINGGLVLYSFFCFMGMFGEFFFVCCEEWNRFQSMDDILGEK